MSGKIRGITVEIGGDTKGLDKAIKSVNSEIRGTSNELKQVERLLKLDPTNTELLAQKQVLLGKNVESVEGKLKALKKAKEQADQDMANGTEVNQEQYRKLQREIVQTEQELKKLGNTADDAGDKIEDVSGESKGFSVLKGTVANLASDGIQALINKTIELVEVTREYREDMNKLKAAYATAGFSQEDANKVYSDFYKLLGESDRSVEAVNHLAQLTDKQEELAKWTNIAAGVNAVFTDSLPIEGLTEAANETAKVAKVTGPLADALNWVGISEDAFNEKLKSCNSEQERASLITNTLNDAYESSAQVYKTMNADIMASREATLKMTEAQAQLGAFIEPLTTSVKNWFADLAINTLDAVGIVKKETVQLTETIGANTVAQNSAREAIYNNTVTQLAQVESCKQLYSELLTLADASGQVKDADLSRAQFIVGQLNEALGLEIQMNGNVVTSLSEISGAIEDVIAKKQAQILLEGQEELYAEAVKNRVQAEKEQADALARIIELKGQYIQIDENSTREEVRGAAIRNAEIDAEIKILTQAYNEKTDLVEKYSTDVAMYEEATAAALEGNSKKVIDILNDEGQAFVDAKDLASKTADEQKGILGQQYIDAIVAAEVAAENYKRVQNDANKQALEEAKTHAENAKKAYEDVGGNIVDGTVEGLNGKKANLKSNLENLMSMVPEWAKKLLGIHSPSWVMRDEVGKMITEGIAIGIEEATPKLEDAIKEQKQTIVGGFKDAAQEAAESIEEIQKAQENLAEKLSNAGNKTFTQYGIGDMVYTKLADVGFDNNQLQQYSNMLDQLFSKRGELPKDIISSLSEMSVEDGINYVTALLQATDAEYDKYIKDLEQKDALAEKISQQLTSKQLAETAAEINVQFSEVASDFFQIGAESAKEYGEGFMKELETVYKSVRVELMKGLSNLNVAGGIASAVANNQTNTTNNVNNNTRNVQINVNTPNPVSTPFQQRVEMNKLINDLATQGVL